MNQLVTKINKQFLGRLCADAIYNLEKAIEKHPTFPALTTNMDLVSAKYSLEEVRSTNESGHSAVGLIATEEELEFNVEVLKGNQAEAYNELVDLMTVWLRVGLHLDDYLSAAHEPRANRVAVARPVGTPSLRIGHEVQPRLGCEKGVQP